jgi:hypothetical protein
VSIPIPFATVSRQLFTEVDPVGGDVDYYRIRARAGEFLAVELVGGVFDATLGIFDAETGQLLITNDDGGGGLLPRIIVPVARDIDLAIAVSAFPDLDFTGDGIEGGRYVLSVSSYRGELVTAGNDTSTPVALGAPFLFQGQTWNSVFVNSDGNLTFGRGDQDFGETVAEFLNGAPRIAPLWDDLDARTGFVIASRDAISTTIHWISVPEFFSDVPNYFSVRLLPLGIVQMSYGATARSDSIVGITQGGGAADPGETDLSQRFLGLQPGRGTTYEQFSFPDPFDLSFDNLFFVPF